MRVCMCVQKQSGKKYPTWEIGFIPRKLRKLNKWKNLLRVTQLVSGRAWELELEWFLQCQCSFCLSIPNLKTHVNDVSSLCFLLLPRALAFSGEEPLELVLCVNGRFGVTKMRLCARPFSSGWVRCDLLVFSSGARGNHEEEMSPGLLGRWCWEVEAEGRLVSSTLVSISIECFTVSGDHKNAYSLLNYLLLFLERIKINNKHYPPPPICQVIIACTVVALVLLGSKFWTTKYIFPALRIAPPSPVRHGKGED